MDDKERSTGGSQPPQPPQGGRLRQSSFGDPSPHMTWPFAQSPGLQSSYRGSQARQPGLAEPFPGASPTGTAPTGLHQYSLSTGSTSSSGMHTEVPSLTPASPPRPDPPSPYAATPGAGRRRGFRQRRKDPSCDACRERKVKCDASDTASCSECASRSIKCQFTKDTNRRMSSIKQIQDLERQLREAQRQIQRLRALLGSIGGGETSGHGQVSTAGSSDVPGAVRWPWQADAELYRTMQGNILVHSRGIFMPPAGFQVQEAPNASAGNTPSMPPRHVSDRLLSQFHTCFHTQTPILDWSSFVIRYEQAYADGTLDRQSGEFTGLFFAVLAVGSIHRHDRGLDDSDRGSEGSDLYEGAVRSIKIHSGRPTLEQCQTSLMISVYCMEKNLMVPCRVWLGVSITHGVELGLHQDKPVASPEEGEMRKMLWLCIYSRDRMLALEMSRPLQIDEQDCRFTIPHPLLDKLGSSSVEQQPAEGYRQPHPVELATGLGRIVARLKAVLRQPLMSMEMQQEFEGQLDAYEQVYPEPMHPKSASYTDPSSLWLTMMVTNVRLILHRQRLSPLLRASERASALGRCTAAARVTVRTIERSLRARPETGGGYAAVVQEGHMWDVQVRLSSSSMMCRHLWRCILVLSLSLDLEGAAMCTRVSGTIGEGREINRACGRNLVFFLQRLKERIESGQGERRQLERDDEMLTYASGDLQGDSVHAWVWGDGGGEEKMAETGEGGGGRREARADAKRRAEGETAADGREWERVGELLEELRTLVAAGGQQRSSGRLSIANMLSGE